MEKQFLEVFKTLDLDKRNIELFDNVTVIRVSATKSRDFVRVYIKSDHLIPKASIYKVEKLLRKSLFVKGQGKVKVYESFNLSDMYTAESLYDAYKDSIMLEIGNCSIFDKTLFENAAISFTDADTMHLDIEDTGFLELRKDELTRILEKIFTERCGVKVNITYSFTKPVKKEKPLEIVHEYTEPELPREADTAKQDKPDLPEGFDSNTQPPNEMMDRDFKNKDTNKK